MNQPVSIIIALSLLYTIPAHSQWYDRQYGVDDLVKLNPEQYQTAFRKSDQLRKIGLYTIGGSFCFAALGSAIGYASFQYAVKTRPDDFFPGLAGIGIMYSAIFTATITSLIGLPPWLIGRSRVKQLKAAFPNASITLAAVPLMTTQQTRIAVCPTLQIILR